MQPVLYKLNIYEVLTLQAACKVAQDLMAKRAEAAECRVSDRHLPKYERVSAGREATWYKNQKADFEAVSKALDCGREITTLAQAKEALDR